MLEKLVGIAEQGGYQELQIGGCTLQNNYSIGTISGGNDIIGYNVYAVNVINCYSKNNTFDANMLGEKYQEDIGINNGYPILKWQVKQKSKKSQVQKVTVIFMCYIVYNIKERRNLYINNKIKKETKKQL